MTELVESQFTTDFTKEDQEQKLELIKTLKKDVEQFYWTLFSHRAGGEFHAFVEWCGVMSEHLNIVEGLLKKGIDATNMNVHSGQALPIPDHQLNYLAEKMECIFDGLIEVRKATDGS